MLIKELDSAIIYSFGNIFSNLMRAPPLNHIQSCPPVLGFRATRRADEQRVSQLALEVILLDMVRQHGRDLPKRRNSSIFDTRILIHTNLSLNANK